ncbi:hypothetical protein KIW84_041894 [Lathyrus oleraceus]|uniref:Uncharacterized protein n=1 Tax=Pisum sativum TaxID=3888 RepID=A0A9D4XB03_PEA|nr:hypothetical protein KIW84_041894 [Pisum sativum]
MDNKKWKELDLRALSIIRMSLAKNILVNVLGTWLAKELLEKLEGLYQIKEVTSKIISEEIRLKGEENTSSSSVLVARGRSYVKKNNDTTVRSWKYAKLGHIKYKCPDREASEKGSESNTSNVSLVVREDNLPWKLRRASS